MGIFEKIETAKNELDELAEREAELLDALAEIEAEQKGVAEAMKAARARIKRLEKRLETVRKP